MPESTNVIHLLHKRPRITVPRIDLWTKTTKHTAVGECSHRQIPRQLGYETGSAMSTAS